ncbi:MAG: TonB family protein, partial [Bryobacterales bacterium]|nr:TonB family protein [Bryobacterales bacterium]
MPSIAFLWTAALKATVIFAAAFQVAFVLRRASASARYFVWTSALATVVAVPLLSVALRPWNVPLAAPAAVIPQVRVFVDSQTPHAASVSPIAHPIGVAWWLISVWLCGVAVILARTATGHARVQLSLRRSEPIRDPEWLRLLADTSCQIGLRRRVDLRRSNDSDVPLSYGLMRPVILLPSTSEDWSVDRRRVVLLHELIHVRRLDWLSCLLSQLAGAAYWFHPLAWMAMSRFRQEQERSCDDAVVIAGTGQAAYAEHLVALARSLTSSRRSWPTALSMAEAGGLEQRVHALLDPRSPRRALSGRVCVAALSGILVCAIPFAALRAQNAGPKSSLTGSVYDPSGAAVPGSTVLLNNVNGKNKEIVRSGGAGEYQLVSLAAGKYDIDVRAPGFAPYQRRGLELNPGTPVHLDIKLDVGSVSEAVDVVGRGPRPASSGPPRRIRVGGNVQATKLLQMTKPVYPAAAQAAGI